MIINAAIRIARNAEILLSNDAYRDALGIHRCQQKAAKSSMSGAKPLYRWLKKQFPRSKNRAEGEPVQAGEPEV